MTDARTVSDSPNLDRYTVNYNALRTRAAQQQTLSGFHPSTAGYASRNEGVREMHGDSSRRESEMAAVNESLFSGISTASNVAPGNHTTRVPRFPTGTTSTSAGAAAPEILNRSSNTSATPFPPGGLSTDIENSPAYRFGKEILRFDVMLSQDRIPPLDDIVAVRNQLYEFLDAQYGKPPSRRAEAEFFLSRLNQIYSRASRLPQVQPPSAQSAMSVPSSALAERNYYLLTSPTGEQALVAPPSPTLYRRFPFNHAPTTTISETGRAQAAARMPPQPMENFVRQAVLNQAARNNGAGTIIRFARRLWLFIRLYFFCYMFSDPGTWSRVFLICLSVVIAFLSETDLPRRIHQAVMGPVHRQLEGFINGGQIGGQREGGARDGREAATAAGPRGGPFGGDNQSTLRRVERLLALFFASLVPGIGERQVRAHNAAAAAAEAARNAERAQRETETRNDRALDHANADPRNDSQNVNPGNSQEARPDAEVEGQAG